MIDREFRVGDKVTCNMFGLGEVIEIDNYYITVIFSNKINGTYSKDGKYNIKAKRTLFILPKIKPTLKQVKEKYKQLLDEFVEVEFVEGEYNYFLIAYFENGKYYFNLNYSTYENDFNKKYITKENTDKIVEQMHEFIKGE